MRATHHFHRGLVLSTPKEKKRISKKHNEIFLEFLFFEEKIKQEREKLFTRESSQQVKEEQEIFLGFLLILLLSLESKLNRTKFLVFLKVYQRHEKKARKRKIN